MINLKQLEPTFKFHHLVEMQIVKLEGNFLNQRHGNVTKKWIKNSNVKV